MISEECLNIRLSDYFDAQASSPSGRQGGVADKGSDAERLVEDEDAARR